MKTRVRATARNLRQRAKELIEVLEPESLETAVKFLSFLEDEEAEAATRELGLTRGLLKAHEKSLKELRAGKKGVNWRAVRNDV